MPSRPVSLLSEALNIERVRARSYDRRVGHRARVLRGPFSWGTGRPSASSGLDRQRAVLNGCTLEEGYPRTAFASGSAAWLIGAALSGGGRTQPDVLNGDHRSRDGNPACRLTDYWAFQFDLKPGTAVGGGRVVGVRPDSPRSC